MQGRSTQASSVRAPASWAKSPTESRRHEIVFPLILASAMVTSAVSVADSLDKREAERKRNVNASSLVSCRDHKKRG